MKERRSKRARRLAKNVVLAATVGGFWLAAGAPSTEVLDGSLPESSTRRRHWCRSLAGAR